MICCLARGSHPIPLWTGSATRRQGASRSSLPDATYTLYRARAALRHARTKGSLLPRLRERGCTLPASFHGMSRCQPIVASSHMVWLRRHGILGRYGSCPPQRWKVPLKYIHSINRSVSQSVRNLTPPLLTRSPCRGGATTRRGHSCALQARAPRHHPVRCRSPSL